MKSVLQEAPQLKSPWYVKNSLCITLNIFTRQKESKTIISILILLKYLVQTSFCSWRGWRNFCLSYWKKKPLMYIGQKNYMQNYIWIFSIQILHSIFWVQLAASELEWFQKPFMANKVKLSPLRLHSIYLYDDQDWRRSAVQLLSILY